MGWGFVAFGFGLAFGVAITCAWRPRLRRMPGPFVPGVHAAEGGLFWGDVLWLLPSPHASEGCLAQPTLRRAVLLRDKKLSPPAFQRLSLCSLARRL